MIGGFVIMIDRPFRQGDRVRLGDGTVCVAHTIGIRSTKFWTFDNTLIIVPNAELMKSTVHNITYPFPRVRVRVNVGVGYDSDMSLVERVMLDEAKRHPKVIDDPKPSFFFLDFGDSSLDVSLRCHVDDVGEQFRTGSDLRFQILERFRVEGIEIPFPQRVVTTVGGKALPSESTPVEEASGGTKSRPKTPSTRQQKPSGPVRGGSMDFDDGDD
jgi:small-conductance mechanosensitive channel